MAISTGAAILGGSIGSAILGSRSASRAADAQTSSNNAAIGEQRRQFDQIMELTAPQRDASNNALSAITDLLGIGSGESGFNAADALSGLPGNEVIVNDVMRRIQQSSPTTGGNVLTALTDRLGAFQSDRLFSRLFQTAGLGAGGTNAAVNGAANSGNAIASLLQSSGMANATGIMGQGQAINSGLQNILQYYALRGMTGGGNAAAGVV